MLVFQQTFGFGASLQVIGGSSSKITTDLGHEAFYLGKKPFHLHDYLHFSFRYFHIIYNRHR